MGSAMMFPATAACFDTAVLVPCFVVAGTLPSLRGKLQSG